MMNSAGFSPSSFFSEDVCVSNERPVSAGKIGHMNGYSGFKSDGMLRTGDVASFENRVPNDLQMTNGFAISGNHMIPVRNINISMGNRIVGAERAVSRSLPNADHDIGARNNSASHLFDGDKVTFMGAQHENGLFSSSLSDIFSQNLSKAHVIASHGVVGSHCEEDNDALESLEELEAKTIGNLLPDDDELLSGVTDGLDSIILQNNGEDADDIDLFSNVGGLELGEDSFSQRKSEFSNVNFNNDGELLSRTLFVRNINSNVEDSELRMLFEQYGHIRTVNTACKQQGFIMISYYDIRAACNAMTALQNKLFMHRKLDIHFSIPKENPSEKDINEGTLVVFNLDSSFSNNELRQMFGAYGEIKEIRDVPHLPHHKFIEFYDVRAAETALCALNTSDIAGKRIKVEPALKRSLQSEKLGLQLQLPRHSSNMATGFAGSFPSTDNGTMLGLLSTNGCPISSIPDGVLRPAVSNSIPSRATESNHIRNHLKFELQHPHSLPEYHDGPANGHPFGSTNISPPLPQMLDGQQFCRPNSNGPGIELTTEAFCSLGNGSCPPPGRHYMWSNLHQPRPEPFMWPNSPTFINGISAVPRAPSHMINPVLSLNDNHVGSAPSINPSLWDRRHAYVGESPDASVFHPGSLGNMRISGNLPHPLDFVPRNAFPCTSGSYTDIPIPSKNIGLHPHNSRHAIFPSRGQMHPMMSSLDSPNERTRNRRNEGSLNQADNKKQFELDIDRIIRGEDKRTTLMIKNIPNKYTSKMLLAAIDERHKGTYDFIYLPIDFKNKCNVGYAFINMIDPTFIVPFYETFNGKKWEKFNSEKVASLAYARIQGRAALIAHFQNSSLMNEDKRCRPILFYTDGPNAGDQVPFPMGANIRPRPGKTRTNTPEENSNQNSPTEEDYNNGDSFSGSGRDSD